MSLFSIVALIVAARVESPAQAADGALTPVGWVLDETGRIYELGGAPDLGDAPGSSSLAVDIAATSDGGGYWVLRANGSISAHGTASFFGDLRSLRLARPAIAISPTPSGRGYVVLGQDGGVFAFGDAGFYGSVPGVSAQAASDTTAVEIQQTAAGYRVIHDDGGVFAFGDASFLGSVPGALQGRSLDRPIVAAVEGAGYAMVGADGGVFAFGMQFRGSIAGRSADEIVGASGDNAGGYLLIDRSGTVSWFSDGSVSQIKVGASSKVAAIAVTGWTPIEPGGTTTTKLSPTTTPAGSVPARSVTIWDATLDAGPDVYWKPEWNDVGNFRSPDLISGDALLEIEILAKPTNREVILQVCAWRWLDGKGFSGGFDETCSSLRPPEVHFTDETRPVVINLGSPDDWWVKGGGTFPWHLGPDVMRILVQDAATRSLMMDSACGAACFVGPGSAADHTPIRIRSKLTFGN